jgi:DNA-binding transcriptional MerR regulator
MGRYSIKELEKLSGIKAHTIRIWEKRHKIIHPERTTTNIRYYSDDDLKKIINVALLNNHGVKISKIAELTLDELSHQVTELSEAKSNSVIHIDQLILAMIELDEENFERILASLILRYGFERTITDMVYPFLEKIGVLWHTGNITPAQEHFITNLIRQKIIVAIDALPLAPKGSSSVVMFLPEQELHELGLLFYYYITKKKGFRVYYLGQMVPYRDIVSICKTYRPSILITSITTSPAAQSVQRFMDQLCSDQPDCTILASGQVLKNSALKLRSNLHLFFSAAELSAFLGQNNV